MGSPNNVMAFSPEIKDLLDAQLMPWERVSSRAMFGCVAYLVGPRLFAFSFDRSLVAKIPAAAKPEAVATRDARPFQHGPGGRFGDWMEFPLGDPSDTAPLLPWVKVSYDLARLAPQPDARKRRHPRRPWKVPP